MTTDADADYWKYRLPFNNVLLNTNLNYSFIFLKGYNGLSGVLCTQTIIWSHFP